MILFNKVEVAEKLDLLPEWSLVGEAIERTFFFADFVTAIEFVNQVAEKAERAGHHPDIDIRWNQVRLALSTHDAGGLTEKDFQLASIVDALL